MNILLYEKTVRQAVPTWELLTGLEPRLLIEERKLIKARRFPDRAFERVFRSVRKRLLALVGWSARRRHSVLRSTDAHHIVLDRLLTIARRSRRRCGELLLQAKAMLPHGGLKPWITANCQIGERQARNYMRLARHWHRIAKSAPGADMSVKQAMRLIAADRNEPWPMPALTKTKTLLGLGTDSLAVIEPMHGRYFYVGVFNDLEGDQPYVSETRRGIIDYAVPRVLKHLGFVPTAEWIIEPFEPRPEADNLGIWALDARQYWRAQMKGGQR